MMKKLISAVALAAALWSSEAQAEGITGNRLYSACADRVNGFGFCLGYVTAWVEFDAVVKATLQENWITHCRPAGMTRQELIDVVTAFLRDHPEHRHKLAISLVQAALIEAFPC